MRQTPNTETVLIEYGFIDNPRDLNKLQNNLLDYAEGVVKAVANYIGVPYSDPNSENKDLMIYEVKKGDTLYSIARENNISVNELKRINNLTTTNLSIGQQLIIPTSNYIEYTVQRGDTLYSIAGRYRTTPQIIRELNRLDSDLLRINQVLLLPKTNA